jgi:phosphopantothenoylcysteine decarboxylase/phosphopantothenate--cysteine ligase
MTLSLHNRRVLLIISGGIAAYKSLDLIRRLRGAGAHVRCVLTEGGAKFITPLAVSALAGEQVYTDLWSLTDEAQMGHIRLAREADLILVAPATANLIAKMAHGLADDLASTILLATTQQIMIAPAMNIAMWQNAATQANLALLRTRNILTIGPGHGSMACGEEGEGRMSEVADIVAAVAHYFERPGPLNGKRALVTSGPTFEPIDPVRFIGNRSSGKQGMAIAEALRDQGAEVTLVTGPTALPQPVGMHTVPVETAREMLAACEAALPVDIAVCAAAVADWRSTLTSPDKIKKNQHNPVIELVENPDILAALSKPGARRPRLVIGFAAETGDVEKHARAKFAAKGCDWLLANEVGTTKVFGADDNQVTLFRRNATGSIAVTPWPRQSKADVARQLTQDIIHTMEAQQS